MKNVKRFLSLIISLSMLLSYVITTAPAASAKDDYTREIEFLTALGVQGFTTSTANQQITRADFAKAMAITLGMDPAEATGTQYFTDVAQDSDAFASVSYLVGMDVIHGYDDTTFMPTNTISYSEGVKLILAALGYTNYAEILGGYYVGYTNLAEDLQLDISVNNENALTKGESALLLCNMLDSCYVELSGVTANGVNFSESTETLMEKVFEMQVKSGLVTSVKTGSLYGAVVETADQIMIDFKNYETTVKNSINFLGVNVNYYVRDDVVIYIEQDEDVVIYEADFDEIKSDTTRLEYVIDDENGTEEYEIDGNAYFVYNGMALNEPTLDELKPDYGEVKLIDNNDDDIIDVVIIWEYKNYVVKSVSSTRITFAETPNKMNAPIDLTDEDKNYNLIYGSNFMDLKLLDTGNVITYAESKDTSLVNMFVYIGEFEGTLEGFSGAKLTAKIDGMEYKVAPGTDLSKLLGVTTTFYMDKNDRITDYLRFDEARYGLITNMVYDESEEILYTKILTEAGITRYTNNLDQKIKYGVGHIDNATKKTVDVLYNEFPKTAGKVDKQLIKYTLTSTGESLASIVVAETPASNSPEYDKIPQTDREAETLRLSFNHDQESTAGNYSKIYRQVLTINENLDVSVRAESKFYLNVNALDTTVITVSDDEELCNYFTVDDFSNGGENVYFQDFKAYNRNKLGAYDFIVVNMDVKVEATLGNDGKQPFIVSEVKEEWDELTESTRYTVSGYTVNQNQTMGTFTILEKDGTDELKNVEVNPIQTTLGRGNRYTKDTIAWEDLKVGDIIIYTVNSMSGKVNLFGMLCKAEDLYTDYCNNDFSTAAGNMILNGNIKAIQENGIRYITDDLPMNDPNYIGIKAWNDGDKNEVMFFRGQNQYVGNIGGVYKYDSDTETVSQITWSDMAEGDRIFHYAAGSWQHAAGFYVIID